MQNAALPPKKGEDPKGGLDPLAAASALVHLPDASQPRHTPVYEGDRFRTLALEPHVETVLCGDTVYNTRGYEVCGVQNQHGKPCRRIGKCPFHDTAKAAAAKDGSNSATPGTPAPGDAAKGAQAATPAAAPTLSAATPSPAPPSAAKPAAASGGGLHADLASAISPTVAAPPRRLPFKTGWSKEEHIRFLNGLQIHGKGAWKEIAQIVVTRNATQVQSHAQKYFMRQKQEKRNKRSIHDLSVDDLTDMPATDLGARQVMAAVSAAAQAALKQAPAPPNAGNLVVPGRSGYLQEQMMMPQLMLQPPLSFPVVAQPSFVSQGSGFTGGSASFATSASGAFSAPAPAYPSAAAAYYGQPHGAQPWYYPPHAYPQQQGSTRVDAHDDSHAPHARHPTQELHTLATQGSLLIPQPLDRQAAPSMSELSMGTPTTPVAPLTPSLSGMLKDSPAPKRRLAEAQPQHEQSRQ